MKSIFKKIAVVLALAMVVTLLPAKPATVSAADDLASKWVRSTCTLYLDAPVPLDSDGTYVSAAYATKKAAVAKEDADGWGTLGYSVSFEAEDPTIVDVGPRYGLITALKVGKTNVIATFTKDGEELTASFPVTVKSYAHSVALTSESEEALNALVVGNDPINLKAVVTDAEGNEETIETFGGKTKLAQLLTEREYVTDYVKFEVTNPEDKTVLEYDSKTYELKAVGEGEATLTLIAYRWDWTKGVTDFKGWKAWRTATKEYTVTVEEAGIVDAVQKTLNTFEVTVSNATVAQAIVDAKLTDELHLSVSREISDSLSIKELAIDGSISIKADTENVLVVKMVDDIVSNSVYTVSYGNTSAQFTGVEAIPVSIELSTEDGSNQALVNTETKLTVSIKTVEGVDITAGLRGNYYIAQGDDSMDYVLDPTNYTILFFEVGKVANITATCQMGWDDDKNEKIEDLTVTRPIVSVDQLTTVNMVDGFAVAASQKGDDAKGLEYKQETINLAVGDIAYLYAKYSTSVNGTKTDAYMLDADFVSGSAFELISSNELVLAISGNALYPLNAGSASVTIKRNGQIIGVAYINVVAARYLNSMDVTLDKRYLSNAVGGDSIEVTVKGTDQLNGEITPTVKVSDKWSSEYVSVTPNGNKLTIVATSAVDNLNAPLTIAVSVNVSYGGVTRPYQFSISVNNVKDKTVNGYKVTVTNDELDTKLGSAKQTTTVEIEELVDGYHFGTYSGAITPIGNVANINGAIGMYVQVLKGSTTFEGSMDGATFSALKAAEAGELIPTTGSAITVSGSAIAAESGTYVVRVYQVKEANATPQLVGNTSFTVKDSTSIAVEVKASTVSSPVTNANASVLQDALQLKVDGNNLNWGTGDGSGISYTIVGCELSNVNAGSTSYFVRTITVQAERNGMMVEYSVAVNSLFKLK